MNYDYDVMDAIYSEYWNIPLIQLKNEHVKDIAKKTYDYYSKLMQDKENIPYKHDLLAMLYNEFFDFIARLKYRYAFTLPDDSVLEYPLSKTSIIFDIQEIYKKEFQSNMFSDAPIISSDGAINEEELNKRLLPIYTKLSLVDVEYDILNEGHIDEVARESAKLRVSITDNDRVAASMSNKMEAYFMNYVGTLLSQYIDELGSKSLIRKDLENRSLSICEDLRDIYVEKYFNYEKEFKENGV